MVLVRENDSLRANLHLEQLESTRLRERLQSLEEKLGRLESFLLAHTFPSNSTSLVTPSQSSTLGVRLPVPLPSELVDRNEFSLPSNPLYEFTYDSTPSTDVHYPSPSPSYDDIKPLLPEAASCPSFPVLPPPAASLLPSGATNRDFSIVARDVIFSQQRTLFVRRRQYLVARALVSVAFEMGRKEWIKLFQLLLLLVWSELGRSGSRSWEPLKWRKTRIKEGRSPERGKRRIRGTSSSSFMRLWCVE